MSVPDLIHFNDFLCCASGPIELGSVPLNNLIILNSPSYSHGIAECVWHSCKLQVCADGGANRLYDAMNNEEERMKYIPTFIIGDLDSVREEVLDYYKYDAYLSPLQICFCSNVCFTRNIYFNSPTGEKVP
jgi:thiamine pyrophosphokinase